VDGFSEDTTAAVLVALFTVRMPLPVFVSILLLGVVLEMKLGLVAAGL
jgi:hypothetical protein